LGRHAPAVLVVTTFGLDEYVLAALRASAAGFLLKDDAALDLPGAVRIVARGDGIVSPALTRTLLATFAGAAPGSEHAARVDDLTGREREVLVLMARGEVNDRIAAELVVSLPTVKTHVRGIFAKLGVTTRAQAVIAAYESGLVRPRDHHPWG
ncbi:MAG: response regulator transcription factor, partial [Phycicoccus sp.]